MNARTKRILFALLSVPIVAGGVWLLAERPDDGPAAVHPPAVDLSRVEPLVKERVEQSRTALTRQSASAARWAELAQVLHAHDYHAEALACYAQAATRAPGDYRWPYLAGVAQAKLDLRAAPPHYEAAAALEPENPAFYINYGDLLQELDRIEAAGLQYRRALELDADSVHALLGLARIALQRDDLTDAERLVEKARTLAPRDAAGHILRSQLLARGGNDAESKREAERAKQAGTPTRAYDPVVAAMEGLAVSSTALSRRGTHLANTGDYAGAEKAFRKVLTIRSGHSGDHSKLAGALARQGKTPEAVRHYEEALRLDPENVDLLVSFGLVLSNAGDAKGGIALLEKALALDETRHDAHHNLGLVYERAGNPDRALAHLRKARELSPWASQVAVDLGSTLARRGRVPEAIEVWLRGLESDPGELSLRYNLAVAYVQQRRHAAALRHLEEGLRHAPRSSRFQALLAWELATAPASELRDGDRALAMAKRLYAAAPTKPETADLLAAALAATARFQEAVRTLEKALAARPAPPAPVAQGLRQRLALYKQDRPYRQPR